MSKATLQQIEGCCPPQTPDEAVSDLLGESADSELAMICRALGHSARVQILRLLIEKNACVCGEIVGELPLAQSTVSQHLKVLKNAGLIIGEIKGPSTCYCVDPARLRRLRMLVASL